MSISLLFTPGAGYTFDMSGRLLAIYSDGLYVARGLDGRMKEKTWTGALHPLDRIIQDVDADRRSAYEERLRRDLNEAGRIVEEGGDWRSNLDSARPEAALTLLRFLQERSERLRDDEAAFHRIYKPVSILPPDQYFTLVLQITEGCPWNKCSFCDFYRDRRFRIRTVEEVDAHAQAVQDFLGDGVSVRQSIFLGDANALVVKTNVLLEIFRMLHRRFPGQMGAHGGVYSFGDVPAILGKDLNELRLLREAGLRRVYVGLESGSDDVRALVKKPGTTSHVKEAVERIKSAGLQTGVIIMLGLGGREMASAHVAETSRLLSQLPLDERDLVYFSPFLPHLSPEYTESARERGLTPLPFEDLRHQSDAIASAAFPAQRRPKIAIYNIHEFIY